MGKKKASGGGMSDKIVKYGIPFGCICCIAASAMPMGGGGAGFFVFLIEKADPLLTIDGWTSYRGWNMLGTESKFKSNVTWGQMKNALCGKADVYARAQNDPMTFAAEQMADGASTLAGPAGAGASAVNAAKSVAGCKMWKICRLHTVERCNTYKTMAFMFTVALGFVMVGGACGVLTAVLVMQEAGVKKKKKVLDAKFNSMMAANASCWFLLLGMILFMVKVKKTLKVIRLSSWYPYAQPYGGTMGFCFGIILVSIGAITSCMRYAPDKGAKKK